MPMKKIIHTFSMILVWLFSHKAACEIAITFPSDRAVFQRNNDNEATIYMGGYITEAFSSIEARLIPIVTGEGEAVPSGGGWATIQTNPTGGNYYGSLTAKGGWYVLEVRGIKSAQAPKVTSLAHVGVGEVFIIAGQSNATGGDGNSNGPGTAYEQVNSVNYQNYNPNASPSIATYPNLLLPCPTFTRLNASVKTAPFGNYAWCWGSFGDKIYEKFHVPVMIFNAGWSSTDIANWQETIAPTGVTTSPFGYTFPQGLPFGHLRAALNYYAAQLGVRAILWHQGESDNYREQGGNPSDDWYNRYRSKLWDVIQGTRATSGKSNLAWVVARVSRFDFPHGSGTTTVSANVINAQNELINNDATYPHVYAGPNTDPYYSLEYRSDQIHFRGDGVTASSDGNTYSGLVNLAGFWADHITPGFLSESVPYPATPPPHVIATPASGTTSITFTAPSGTPAPQYRWFVPDTDCNDYPSSAQQWTKEAGTYQLKIIDNLNNIVLSPKLYVSGSTALPVTWQYFLAQTSANNRPLLRWATSSETNASHFEVQRSRDARTFTTVGTVNASGDSKSVKEYRFEDESIPAGTYYYRLMQLDLDGLSEISRMAVLNISGTESMKIFPNPATDLIVLQADHPLNLVEISDLTGKKIYSERHSENQAEIKIDHWTTGLYFVQVNGRSFKVVK
jgi:hypothetical protein